MPTQCQRRDAGCQRSSVRDSTVDAGTPMQELLEIRLLGPFEVLAGGMPADVGGSKRQALLAMLALRLGRMVGVDALVDGLVGRGAAGRSAERAPPSHCPASGRARGGVDRRLDRRARTRECARGCGAVRGAA